MWEKAKPECAKIYKDVCRNIRSSENSPMKLERDEKAGLGLLIT
jgi:hypothetical protein